MLYVVATFEIFDVSFETDLVGIVAYNKDIAMHCYVCVETYSSKEMWYAEHGKSGSSSNQAPGNFRSLNIASFVLLKSYFTVHPLFSARKVIIGVHGKAIGL